MAIAIPKGVLERACVDDSDLVVEPVQCVGLAAMYFGFTSVEDEGGTAQLCNEVIEGGEARDANIGGLIGAIESRIDVLTKFGISDHHSTTVPSALANVACCERFLDETGGGGLDSLRVEELLEGVFFVGDPLNAGQN